jgi:hypothetical protein
MVDDTGMASSLGASAANAVLAGIAAADAACDLSDDRPTPIVP